MYLVFLTRYLYSVEQMNRKVLIVLHVSFQDIICFFFVVVL